MNGRSILLAVYVRGLYWIILVVSGWLFLRGHNVPGGGFIAGLVAVSATVAFALAFGSEAAEKRMPLRSRTSCALLGTAVMIASGLPSIFRGVPFLSHPWATWDLGLFELSLSTVMLFDLGVFLAVWGGIGGYALHLIAIDETEETEETE